MIKKLIHGFFAKKKVRRIRLIPVELPRKGLRLQYRLIIHKSNITNDDLKNLYNDYEKDARRVHKFTSVPS